MREKNGWACVSASRICQKYRRSGREALRPWRLRRASRLRECAQDRVLREGHGPACACSHQFIGRLVSAIDLNRDNLIPGNLALGDLKVNPVLVPNEIALRMRRVSVLADNDEGMGGRVDLCGQCGLDAADVVSVDFPGRCVTEHELEAGVLVPSL